MVRQSQRIEKAPKQEVRKRKPGAGAPRGNRNAEGNRGGGRKPIYSVKLLPIVEGMASDGATDFEIASRLGISKETSRWWRWEHIEFANAMNVGRGAMVERAKASLFHRAIGYSFPSEKVFQSQGHPRPNHRAHPARCRRCQDDSASLRHGGRLARQEGREGRIDLQLGGSRRHEHETTRSQGTRGQNDRRRDATANLRLEPRNRVGLIFEYRRRSDERTG
jgi:hypothetical protein